MSESDRTTQLRRTGARAREEAPTAAAHARPAPTGAGALVLGRYRLEDRIGRGGHGTVWEAVDERLERRVAVKVISRADGGVGDRAEREGRVAAQLNHPGIVGLYELGSDEDSVYLVSELVHGRAMGELAGAGALSDRDVCQIGIALCAALEHAHARGVVHRDVKPQNVIVVAEPAAGAGFAKLTDFGVAHVAGEDRLTRTGDVVGTLAYMAPEQAEGGPVTGAADVYALALVLYEGWTGAGPDGAVAARLAGRRLPPLARRRGDLPQRLCRTVDAALDPRPAARPRLSDLAAELRATAEGLSEEGGLVEAATRRRFGIPSAAAVRPGRLPFVPQWALRAAAGLAAGGLVLTALDAFAAPESVPAVTIAGVAAATVALLPRIGWMLVVAGLLVWLASPGVGHRGTALILAAALAPVPALLPRAGLLWSVPALAPLLGAIALAPLFVAVAGIASTAWRRLGLAIAGFGWLLAAELLSGRALLFGLPSDVEPPAVWEDTVLGAARDAIYPAISSLVLVPGAVWAGLALALGFLVRGRSPGLDLAGAVLWAIALILAHEWLADLLAQTAPDPVPSGAVAGAVLGALLALAAAAGLRRRRSEAPYVP